MSSSDAEKPNSLKGQRNEMRTIARAASVLRALAEGSGNMSLGQISKSAGLPRSSVQRIVGAMEVEGLVMTLAGQAGVRLGRELLRLGAAAQTNLRALIHPHLQVLHDKTNDTIDLTLLMDGVPIVIDQISSTAALRVVSYVGRPLPLHATASGKSHLMNLSRPTAAALLKAPLLSFTPHTITDAEQLLTLAGSAAKREFSYDNEEYVEGVCAIALPIRTFGSENYAVAASMPSNRFAERKSVLREALREAQSNIEYAVGTA